MKGNFSFGKRLLSAALAAAMAATAMGTQAFAQPEETEESAQVQPSRVVSWSWPEEAGLDWSEEDQAWLLSCVYSEEQPLTEETLTQLLPGQITAVVQASSVSQPESTPVAPAQEEPAVVDTDTVEDLTVVEENVSTFETAANSDTVESDQGGAVSDSAEDQGKGFSEELGESTSGNVEAASQTLSLDLNWDFSGLSFPVQPGQYSIQASLPEEYLLDANASPLSLTLAVLPGNDLAADTGLCIHHPQHTAECGYVAGVHACKFAEEGCPYCVVSWTWVDDQGFLVEMDGSWGMGMPGVSQNNPLTRDALSGLLPAQINATTSSGETLTLALTWDLSAIPEEGATSGDYSVSATLSDTQYALTEAAAPLTITLQLGGAETYEALPSGEIPYTDKIVNGVSPNGTTIDLFDYWITTQTASDNSNGDGYAFLNQGINENHALIFGNGLTDYKDRNDQNIGYLLFGNWNVWTRSEAPYEGIVSDKLVDGYPQLNLGESISYNQAQQLADRNGNESLDYLFDPAIETDGKESYEDVQGLLQVDEDGYYYYDSAENYAVYYPDTNSFTLYRYPGVLPGGQSPVGQFFPFNEANANAQSKWFAGNDSSKADWYTVMNQNTSTDGVINHYFGIHMTTRFVQQNQGYTDSTNRTPVTYEFSGDDDVWIYIDGVLVADLGGNHNAASVNINFATGEIWINGKLQNDRLGNYFGSETTLADNTYHTLDFFYLERGNVDSNMQLKYNLVTIPESSLIKVDQLGYPVPGAEFTLYQANDYNTNGDKAMKIATGITDRDGEFVFVTTQENGDTFPITVEQLYNAYGQKGGNLVLVETGTPSGYRTTKPIELYFFNPENTEEVLLLSENIWTTGSYAMPKATATTPNVIRLLKDNGELKKELTLVGTTAVENPLMFAVIFQKQGNKWYPVSGDPLKGWTVATDSSWNSILEAALADRYVFQLASSGAYQVEVSNLPGDIRKYYHITKDEDTAEYSVGYYYTEAATLEGATADNTWRIDSDPTPENKAYALSRVFSVDLYVTNIQNRLFVQKVDDQGKPVVGAKFALYDAGAVDVGEDGSVTIKDGKSTIDSLTTKTIGSPLNLDGGGIFPTEGHVLNNGEYYLIETDAPTGYRLNETAVHVIVDNTGVYADAGNSDDGVSVLRGVGSVVKSMVQFAVDDHVDVTLNEIKAALATDVEYDEDSKKFTYDTISDDEWNDENSDQVLHLKYKNDHNVLDYGPYDGKGTLDNLTLETTSGWSKLLIRQCYNHKNQSNTELKTNLGQEGINDITDLFSGTVTVRVANQRVGNLKITKKVTGDSAPNETFTFHITLSGENLSDTFVTVDQDGKENSLTFNNGKATIELKKDQSLTIRGIPADIQYTVQEDSVAGFATSVTINGTSATIPASGTIQQCTVDHQAEDVAFTNNFDGDAHLVIHGTKKVDHGVLANGSKFTFKLSAANESAFNVLSSPVYVTIEGDGTMEEQNFTFPNLTFEEAGNYIFTVREEVPDTATDNVADGILYDVHLATVEVEVERDSSTNILSVKSVTYNNETSVYQDDRNVTDKAAFTNAYQSLEISKTVTGELGDKTRFFTFTLSLTQNGTPITGTYLVSGLTDKTEIAFDADGKATIQLKDGQSATINNLPVGATCTVTEATAPGYTMNVSVNGVDGSNGAQVTIANNRTQTVAFTNDCTMQVPTGLHGETRPYKAMVGLAGAAAVLGIAGWIAMRRRKRREQE